MLTFQLVRKHVSVAKFPEVSSDTCIECDVTDDVISRDVVYHVMHVWNFLGLGLRVYKELYCLWCMLTCLLAIAYLLLYCLLFLRLYVPML